MNTRLREKLLEDKELCDLTMTDEEVCQTLGIKMKTLRNKISSGDFVGMYSMSPLTRKRFWFKPKVMGLS